MNAGPRRLYTLPSSGAKYAPSPEQGVATDAIARFPNVLAAKDRLSQVLAVVTLGKRAHGIERQSDQHQEEEHSTAGRRYSGRLIW